MRKLFKLILGIVGILIFITWLSNPQLFRIIWYQKPKVDTYKSFPLRVVNPSNDPFRFIHGYSESTNLDSLIVENGKGACVLFHDYFNKGDLLAFLVVRNDTLIYEKYKKGFNRSNISNTFSIGKSMISILIGKAIDIGHIQSVDQKVIKYLPEFKGLKGFDKLTIDNLLNMKSGLKFKRAGNGYISDIFSDEARLYYSNQLKRDLLKAEIDTVPGSRWQYSNLDPLILTWLLEKVTGQKVSAFFEKEIWKPIGAEFAASWGVDHATGLENSPSSFQCSAIDLAKIGRLLINQGMRDSTRILSSDWIDRSVKISQKNRMNISKGSQKATHQYFWWLPQEDFEGDFSAEGLRGQRLYVNPKQNIIIVQFANQGYGGYPYRTISHYFFENRH
ncbi:CubicO group peptidase, beta-lactamase class C family [Arenibacter palladensis]|uniref:CubicO group peptidase, beta-lactamase class C family n=1 Tax=Arenibacter palladensis TaxID=237373 RepID=A0A1M4Y0B6_9FLAO|nr:serine hydrolase [Arenibacter palladensis]SHE99181.1 CubicO group peptidase, beta-lactamase class C family [Arenibacter palladensis]